VPQSPDRVDARGAPSGREDGEPDDRREQHQGQHVRKRIVHVDPGHRRDAAPQDPAYIYGVGRTRALESLKATGIDGNIRVKDLTDDQLVALRDHIEGAYKIEGDLRREVAADIRRKVEIGTYQGIRHRRGLPVHGQRTHTNARTRKGPRKAVAGKKKPGKK
jgi:small subunit ribosomal protein S13